MFIKTTSGSRIAARAVIEIDEGREVEPAPGIWLTVHTIYYQRGDEVLEAEATALAIEASHDESTR